MNASKTSQLVPLFAPVKSASDVLEKTGFAITLQFARDEMIYSDNKPAEYLYKVVSGMVRMFTKLADGRRKIDAFYLPGDYFGLETDKRHTRSAQATTASTIRAIGREKLGSLATRDVVVAKQLLDITAVELQRTQNYILLLHKTALERVATFLLEITSRIATLKEIEFPISHKDIADYLDLTITVVTRTLNYLAKAEIISLSNSRRVTVRDRNALARLYFRLQSKSARLPSVVDKSL